MFNLIVVALGWVGVFLFGACLLAKLLSRKLISLVVYLWPLPGRVVDRMWSKYKGALG